MLASKAEPLGFTAEGLLRVGVADLAWREVLFEERRRITGRLRRTLPHCTGIRLERVAAVAPAPQRPPPAAAPVRADTAFAADSPALRQALDRLLQARDQRHAEREVDP